MQASPVSSWLSRRVLGWALFDVASSTHIALVPTYFGLYFAAVVARGQPSASAWWGVIAATSLALASVLAPIVGAYADRTARWLRVVVAATALCVVATLLLPAASAAGILVAGVTFVVTQTGYMLATSVYDSLVVDLAPPDQRSRVSGLGWALGLIGGIVAVAAALLLVRGQPAAEQVRHLGAVFVLAGALFAVLSVPGLAGLRGLRASTTSLPIHAAGLAASLRAVGSTLRRWRNYRPALQVLISGFLINDVLVTIQFFIAIVLSARFGLAVEGLLWLSLLFHLIAIPSTVVSGVLADRWGSRPTLIAMCALLLAAILLLAVGRADWVPTAAVALLGLVYSAIQALFRSLYGSVVPPAQAAELFGLNAVAGRLSAAVGPLIFGVAAAIFGSKTLALGLLLLPLVAGVWLLAVARLPSHREDAEVPMPVAADGGERGAA